MRLRWLKRVKKKKKEKRGGEHNFVVFPSLPKNITTAIQRQSLLAVGPLTRLMLAASRRRKKKKKSRSASRWDKEHGWPPFAKKRNCVPPIAFGHGERKPCHVVICPHWCFWFKLWLSCSLSLSLCLASVSHAVSLPLSLSPAEPLSRLLLCCSAAVRGMEITI